MQKRKLIAGNWKMNGRRALAQSLALQLKAAGAGAKGLEVALCPPTPLLGLVGASIAGSAMCLGAQDCSQRQDGAFTGDVSAALLKDMGCTYVILGHSERREYHNESDSLIAAKMAAAHKVGLSVILCIGEKDPKMNQDAKKTILNIQLQNSVAASATSQNLVIAYEPVWAIGSGLTPTSKQIEDTHAYIAGRLPERLKGTRILYGGSVNDKNAAEILALKGVDGALVGGASLKADSFLKIIGSATAH